MIALLAGDVPPPVDPPPPDDPAIALRQVPPTRYAVVKYSGFWSENAYQQYEQQLHDWIAERGFEKEGEPVWAKYNPPFTPWFLRRNEVLIAINGVGTDRTAMRLNKAN